MLECRPERMVYLPYKKSVHKTSICTSNFLQILDPLLDMASCPIHRYQMFGAHDTEYMSKELTNRSHFLQCCNVDPLIALTI